MVAGDPVDPEPAPRVKPKKENHLQDDMLTLGHRGARLEITTEALPIHVDISAMPPITVCIDTI